MFFKTNLSISRLERLASQLIGGQREHAFMESHEKM